MMNFFNWLNINFTRWMTIVFELEIKKRVKFFYAFSFYERAHET